MLYRAGRYYGPIVRRLGPVPNRTLPCWVCEVVRAGNLPFGMDSERHLLPGQVVIITDRSLREAALHDTET